MRYLFSLPVDLQSILNQKSKNKSGNGFEISNYEQNVTEIIGEDGVSTYTLVRHTPGNIYKKNPSEDYYFENLVIRFAEKPEILVIRYEPTINWQKGSRDFYHFSGTISFYSLEGKKLNFRNEKKIPNNQNYKSAENECIWVTDSVHTICTGGKCKVTYYLKEYCTSTTEYDSNNGGGDNEGGFPGHESIPTVPTEPDDTWDTGSNGGTSSATATGEEDQIYIELGEKEFCTYERLNYAGVNATNYHNLMTQLFTEFGEGNLGSADLTIVSEDLDFSGGKSLYLGDGKFKIIISNMADRSSIEIAAVILHEMAHAFLAKHYLMYNKSFTELYMMYMNDSGLQNYSHDIMKDKFLNRMAQTLYDYDPNLFPNFDDYITLASAGVYSNYSEEQLAEIKRIKNYALQNDSRCTSGN